MKIRNGFVSNSSSSSFVVVKPIEKMDETKEEVIKKFIADAYGYYDEDEAPYLKEKFEELSKLCEDVEAFELIHASIEMGGEEDTMSLLDKLGIIYIFEEM